MSWTSDPELQQMFLTELEERSARLLEGARAMQEGTITDDVAGVMLREGHTIKGTSRVMGYEALSRAGQLIEQLWRGIQHGDFEPFPELGEALEEIAGAMPAAAVADSMEGTPELTAALARLNRTAGQRPVAGHGTLELEAPQTRAAHDVTGQDAALSPDQPVADEVASPGKGSATQVAPPASAVEQSVDTAPEPEPHDADVRAEVIPLHPELDASGGGSSAPRFGVPEQDRAALGGLLGALESWATEQTMAVNAGRLYRLINAVADIRNEMDAVKTVIKDDHPATTPVAELSATLGDLQHDALALAAIPLSGMTGSLPQLVRYLAKKVGKDVSFELVGDDDIAVDRQVVDMISDPVRQLIVNAIRHGIEPGATRVKLGKPTTGSISLTTAVKDRRLDLVITDDGAGVDWETVRAVAIEEGRYPPTMGVDVDKLRAILFAKGFSTVQPDELGGQGAGLATVAEAVEALLGRIKLESTAGVGTTVTITVPMSRALQRVLIVEEGGIKWGLPEAVVDEVIPCSEVEIDWRSASPELTWQNRSIPVVPFGELVGGGSAGDPNMVIIVSHRVGEFAITTESVVGVREVAVKELGPLLSGPSHISGGALLGGGHVVLVLDAGRLLDRIAVDGGEPPSGARVLVVDDSLGARAVVSGALASSGFLTSVASSVSEALEVLRTQGADAVVVDFSMPQEDGIALVDQVRASFQDLPVIMLSGAASPEDEERARQAGVDAFFEKADFREGALAETLWRMLDARGSTG